MKNAILSYATNARFEDFYRFIASARLHCDPDRVDIAILIDEIGPEFARVAVDHGVSLVPVVNVWRSARKSRLLNLWYHANMRAIRSLIRVAPTSQAGWIRQAYRHLVAGWVHPQAGRWIAYHEFVKVNSAYRMYMTSDLRDVVFQSDPFDGLDPGRLHAFEQDGIRYGGDNIDTDWFRNTYGADALRAMSGATTLCSGTVLGGAAEMLRLLELMAEQVEEHARIPLDQAMFNEVVAHRFDPTRLTLHGLKGGPVLTLTGDHEGLWEIREGRVEVGGRVVPVVHMYDRLEGPKELFLGRFPIPGSPTAAG